MVCKLYLNKALFKKNIYFYFAHNKIQNQAKQINGVRSQESGYLWGGGRG